MATNIVRRLDIDLTAPIARQWNGGDAFRTALFNALSMSFPQGEQFFIDSLRDGVAALPAAERARLAIDVPGFIGQEATHRRIHGLFNAHLAEQGHVNSWQGRIAARIRRLDGADPRHAVAATAATEHLTAVLAGYLFNHNEALAGAEPRLQAMWLWHASEEIEHCSTAFDLYRAMGGSERWRRSWFRRVSGFFAIDLMRQTVRNLQHDRELWRPATWRSAARFLFGREGLLRNTCAPWRAYLRPGFHPTQHDAAPARQWLRNNAAAYRVVGSNGSGESEGGWP